MAAHSSRLSLAANQRILSVEGQDLGDSDRKAFLFRFLFPALAVARDRYYLEHPKPTSEGRFIQSAVTL